MIVPRDFEGQHRLWRLVSSIFGNGTCPEPEPCPTCEPEPCPTCEPEPCPTCEPCPQPEPCPKVYVRALYWNNLDTLQLEQLIEAKFPVFRPEFPDFPDAPRGSLWYKLESFDVSLVLSCSCDDPTDWELPLGCYVKTPDYNYHVWRVLEWQGTSVNFCLRVWCDSQFGFNIAWFRDGLTWDRAYFPRGMVSEVWLSLPIFGSPVWLVYPTVCWDMVYFEGGSDVVYETAGPTSHL